LKGEYENSLRFWRQDTSKHRDVCEYMIASNYARMGKIDSAFFHLEHYIEISRDDRPIIIDNSWNKLRKDTLRWQQIINKIESFYLKELAPNCNEELALELFYLGIYDQKYRMYLPLSYQYDEEKKSDVETQENSNIRNKRFNEILLQYGFPAISLVGKLGSMNAFLLLQHSGYDLRKNYPLLKKCYEAGELDTIWYAMATDRFLTHQGKKQLYGTQFVQGTTSEKRYPGKMVLWPVKDFKNINQRRKEMGFPDTIEENVRKSNSYIPPEYYKGKGKVRWVTSLFRI
jgi:hypothetical protein